MTYEVIAVTAGDDRRQGGIWKAEFEKFDDAVNYRIDNNQVGNLHIKMPDGTWWPEDYKP